MEIRKVKKKPMKIRRAKEQSIKVKTDSIKLAGVQGAKSATRQIEGGQEVLDAAMTAYVISKPERAVAKHGTKLVKRKSKRIKISQANVRKSKRERNETGIRRGTNPIQIKRRKIPIPENQIKSIKRARSVALRNSSIRHNLPYY